MSCQLIWVGFSEFSSFLTLFMQYLKKLTTQKYKQKFLFSNLLIGDVSLTQGKLKFKYEVKHIFLTLLAGEMYQWLLCVGDTAQMKGFLVAANLWQQVQKKKGTDPAQRLVRPARMGNPTGSEQNTLPRSIFKNNNVNCFPCELCNMAKSTKARSTTHNIRRHGGSSKCSFQEIIYGES